LAELRGANDAKRELQDEKCPGAGSGKTSSDEKSSDDASGAKKSRFAREDRVPGAPAIDLDMDLFITRHNVSVFTRFMAVVFIFTVFSGIFKVLIAPAFSLMLFISVELMVVFCVMMTVQLCTWIFFSTIPDAQHMLTNVRYHFSFFSWLCGFYYTYVTFWTPTITVGRIEVIDHPVIPLTPEDKRLISHRAADAANDIPQLTRICIHHYDTGNYTYRVVCSDYVHHLYAKNLGNSAESVATTAPKQVMGVPQLNMPSVFLSPAAAGSVDLVRILASTNFAAHNEFVSGFSKNGKLVNTHDKWHMVIVLVMLTSLLIVQFNPMSLLIGVRAEQTQPNPEESFRSALVPYSPGSRPPCLMLCMCQPYIEGASTDFVFQTLCQNQGNCEPYDCSFADMLRGTTSFGSCRCLGWSRIYRRNKPSSLAKS